MSFLISVLIMHILYHFLFSDVINGQTIVPDEQMQEVEKFKGSISTIRDMFMRDTMKVAFFGRLFV